MSSMTAGGMLRFRILLQYRIEKIDSKFTREVISKRIGHGEHSE